MIAAHKKKTPESSIEAVMKNLIQSSPLIREARLFKLSDATLKEHLGSGVPNLSLTMYPFSIPTDEHVPLQHFKR